MSPKTVRVGAPAKVNLCLHVTGQREDGYHLLDTLVAFGPACDTLYLTDAQDLSLALIGSETQGVPTDDTNLVIRAARLVRSGRGAEITLEKSLPSAAGIGGGSSDAAAAIRGLSRLWDEKTTDLPAAAIAALGTDIPMCLTNAPLRATGIGTSLTPLPGFPRLAAVLANPRVPVSTPQVFARLTEKENAPLPQTLPHWSDARTLCDWLATTRNDLEAPAIALAPEIARVRDALWATEGALIARMSGSGATCFAIYPDLDAARAAAQSLARDHPGWWLAEGWMNDDPD